ncbi:MAG: transporter substrate-binding domain-containing protein [Hyphomicrobiales bacterium]
MKRLLTVLLLSILFVPPAQADALRIGVEDDYPPLSWQDQTGTSRGLIVDIALALCARMAADCTLVPMRFADLVPALASGKLDAAVAAMAATDERRKQVLFTPPFARSPGRLVVRKGEGTGYVSPSKLKGLTLAAQSGTTFANYLEENYPDSTVKTYAKIEEALGALADRKVDAVLADSIELTDWLSRDPGRQCCVLDGPPVTDPKWLSEGFSIAVPKGSADLAKRLSDAVTAIRGDGTFERLNGAYAPFSLE